MNTQKDLSIQMDDDSLESNIECAIAEKIQAGYANTARYGFVARLANATPPVNANFQHTLRSRVLDELTKDAKEKKQTMTIQEHKPTIGFRRLSLVGGVTVTLALILGGVVFQGMRMWKHGTRGDVPTAVPASQLASEDIDMLVDRLNEDSTPRTVVVFPGDYASTLAERIQYQVIPLVLDDDPVPMAIQAALGAALPPNSLVDVILIDPEATATANQVRAELERRFYRLYRPGETGTETFGALEHSQFIVGPQDVSLEPIGAIFEGGIELVAGGVLGTPQPGTPLPLAFDWRVAEPVSDSPVVFAHLIHNDSRLIAQWDAVPGSETFPMVNWEPGELVRHQFALLVPSELPAGKYEIQVGIYNSTSGQRYSVIEPAGGAPYVVVKQFTIED